MLHILCHTSIERAQLSEHGKIIRDNLCSFVADRKPRIPRISRIIFFLNPCEYSCWIRWIRVSQAPPKKWNPCGPKMPTNLCEISHHQKQNLWDLWDPCEPKSHPQKRDPCEPKKHHKAGFVWRKRLRGWGGYHFLRSLSLKKTIAISYDFFVLIMNTKAAAITR